jgi:hypothetical protein
MEERYSFIFIYVIRKGVLVVRIDDQLYFGNVGRFKGMLKKIETFGIIF